MVLYGLVWSCVVLCGLVWSCMILYGLVWFWMVLYCLVWLFMVLYGFSWFLMAYFGKILIWLYFYRLFSRSLIQIILVLFYYAISWFMQFRKERKNAFVFPIMSCQFQGQNKLEKWDKIWHFSLKSDLLFVNKITSYSKTFFAMNMQRKLKHTSDKNFPTGQFFLWKIISEDGNE